MVSNPRSNNNDASTNKSVTSQLRNTIYTLLAFSIIPMVIEVLFVGETAKLFPVELNTLSALRSHVQDENLYSTTRYFAQRYLDSRFGSPSSDGYQGWFNVIAYFQVSNFFKQEQVVDNIWGGFLDFLDSQYYYGEYIQLFSRLGKLFVGMGIPSPQLEFAFDFLLASPFRILSLVAFIFVMIFGITMVFIAIGRILRQVARRVYHQLVGKKLTDWLPLLQCPMFILGMLTSPTMTVTSQLLYISWYNNYLQFNGRGIFPDWLFHSPLPKLPVSMQFYAFSIGMGLAPIITATSFGAYLSYKFVRTELYSRQLMKEQLAPPSNAAADTPTNTAWAPPRSNGPVAVATETEQFNNIFLSSLPADERDAEILRRLKAL